MMKGECNCGQVSFEIGDTVSDVYICHCSICRRSSGTNGMAVIVIENEHFRWLGNRSLIHTWRKPRHDWENSFCSQCGSSLPGKNDDERMYIPVGLISDGAEQLKVAHHIWVDSKAPWDHISDKGKQHPEAFSGP